MNAGMPRRKDDQKETTNLNKEVNKCAQTCWLFTDLHLLDLPSAIIIAYQFASNDTRLDWLGVISAALSRSIIRYVQASGWFGFQWGGFRRALERLYLNRVDPII